MVANSIKLKILDRAGELLTETPGMKCKEIAWELYKNHGGFYITTHQIGFFMGKDPRFTKRKGNKWYFEKQ